MTGYLPFTNIQEKMFPRRS